MARANNPEKSNDSREAAMFAKKTECLSEKFKQPAVGLFDGDSAGRKALDTLIRCPGCGQKCAWQNNPHRPFCSERCRTIDLGQWASEGYVVAGKPVPIDEEEPEV